VHGLHHTQISRSSLGSSERAGITVHNTTRNTPGDTTATQVATPNSAALPQRSYISAPSSGASRIIVFCPAWMAPPW
jgi:hypothetical protein